MGTQLKLNEQLKKVNDNLILYFIEPEDWTHDDNDNEIITVYLMSFAFYDCHYFVKVTQESLTNDSRSIAMVEGDARLMTTFSELCENELWKFIKNACASFKENHESKFVYG